MHTLLTDKLKILFKKNYFISDNVKIFIYRFVDGGGVTATIVDSNIRTTNGIIHQVDKVFFLTLN